MKNLLLYVVFALFTNALYAQATGKLAGKITEEYFNEPLMFGSLTLVKNGVTVMQAETDTAGNYQFEGVPQGTYDLYITYIYQSIYCIKTIKIRSREFLTLNIDYPTRDIEVMQLNDTIFKTLERPIIQIDLDINRLNAFIYDKKTTRLLQACEATIMKTEGTYRVKIASLPCTSLYEKSYNSLFAGVYELEIQASGYPTLIVQNIKIPPNEGNIYTEFFMSIYLDSTIPEDQILVKTLE
jgi:hypothetical protein